MSLFEILEMVMNDMRMKDYIINFNFYSNIKSKIKYYIIFLYNIPTYFIT